MDSLTETSLVVLTPIKFLERLKLSFMAASKKYSETTKTVVAIKFANNVDELMMHGQGASVADYVAIFISTMEGNCVLRCREYLKSISAKIACSKLVIVNGTCRSGALSAAKELIALGDEFRIPIVNAEIADDTSCKLVGEKIVNLAAKVSGVTTGMPIVIPTPIDIKTSLSYTSRWHKP